LGFFFRSTPSFSGAGYDRVSKFRWSQERDVRLEFIKSWNPLSQHSGENQSVSMDPLSLSLFGGDEIRANAIQDYHGKSQFHYTATGMLKKASASTLVLKLKIRGQKDRTLHLPVSAGMTTYLHLQN
ncbi:MAG: hypothetical protein K2X47_12180, partial [Bdellovibrionales bacterium]|nr:hypothetical protein [Bdellovibrionales bacterium]